MGLIGAVGALGGVGINLAFRESFLNSHSGTPAFVSFLAYYAVCFAVTWAVYLRRAGRAAAGTEQTAPTGAAAYAEV
jgi:NNP family nitrate/nitrite transporter-like MFS transporter